MRDHTQNNHICILRNRTAFLCSTDSCGNVIRSCAMSMKEGDMSVPRVIFCICDNIIVCKCNMIKFYFESALNSTGGLKGILQRSVP